jgi:hypothetical protein
MLTIAQTESLPEIVWNAATPTAIMWYLYALIGIGVYGGYEYWGFFGRTLYWFCFPVHAGVITIAMLVWGYIRLAVSDVRYVSTPFIFIVVFGLFSIVMGPLGSVIGLVIASILAYRHWTTGSW